VVFDSKIDKDLEAYREEGNPSSRPAERDDEAALWEKFEAQLEGDNSSDEGADFFAEDDEVGIPPKSGALIDRFPSLETTKRENILDIVRQLIAQEIDKS